MSFSSGGLCVLWCVNVFCNLCRKNLQPYFLTGRKTRCREKEREGCYGEMNRQRAGQGRYNLELAGVCMRERERVCVWQIETELYINYPPVTYSAVYSCDHSASVVSDHFPWSYGFIKYRRGRSRVQRKNTSSPFLLYSVWAVCPAVETCRLRQCEGC